jgi:hypothetical protein
MALEVPQPTLGQAGAPGSVLSSAQPIDLACGPVTFPDGVPLVPGDRFVAAGFRLLRGSGGGEAWDAAAKAWVPVDAEPAPEPLFFEGGTWRGLLVAVGEKDEVTGADKLATDAASGEPQYAIRCLFAGIDSGGAPHDGSSPASEPVQVIQVAGRDRAGLRIDTEAPADATEVRMFLADAGLAERGSVLIKQEGAGYRAEIAASGARVSLLPNGAIELVPAAGRLVTVTGDMAVTGDLDVTGEVKADELTEV